MQLESIIARMAELGVTRLYAKALSPNDNSKNQVYLGGDFSVLNVLPAKAPHASTSGSHDTPIFTAQLEMSWLDEQGVPHRAPRAQLILYPQYPEVRLSGFLRSAPWAPSEVMRSRAPGRVMLFGVTPAGWTYCYAVFSEHPVARELAAHFELEAVGVLRRVPLQNESADSKSHLLQELCRISRKDWIAPWRLKRDGARDVCRGVNCVGVTLESELGILANGRSDPDFEGWEIKAHTVPNFHRPYSGVLTLLTPEPNGGYYTDHGVEAFVRRFGYADRAGREDRFNFGGIHKVGATTSITGLRLELSGFDIASGKLTDTSGFLALITGDDHVAASWSFAGLLAHWARKHAKAAYVPAEKRKDDEPGYRYGTRITCAEGTDYTRLLNAMAAGRVYLDPGIKLENASTSPKVKRRNQFRVKFADLGYLYDSMYELDACGS